MLAAFDGVVENGAERVFRQFEEEGRHRRALEDLGLREHIRERTFGQRAAALFAFAALASAVTAMVLRMETTAAVIAGTTIVGVVGAFLYRRRTDD